jgi:RNA-binding protein PNO1
MKRRSITKDLDEMVSGAAALSAAGGGGGGAAAEAPASAPAAAAQRPAFPPLSASAAGVAEEARSLRVPSHRYSPLKEAWEEITAPIVNHLKLMVRMNTRTRCVELKTSAFTTDTGALQRAEDFVKAFLLGFEVRDAIALLRLEDLYVESFEVTDVKPLKGDHLSRAIGRIAGQGGKTKNAIENATRVRIVVADSKVHILGAFSNIQVARDALCALIMGAPPGKVYNNSACPARRFGAPCCALGRPLTHARTHSPLLSLAQ